MENNGVENNIEKSKIEKTTESIASLDVEYITRYFQNRKMKTDEFPEITFGRYYEENEYEKKSIRWQVLNIKKNKALLISKYALDCQRYNPTWEDSTWETCSLREWLNSAFLNIAFSAKEQELIQNTTVSADKNPKYSTDPGNDTTDKIFLLSIAEAKKYLTSNEKRKCVPTAYAISQVAYTNNKYTKDGKATCWWWLRSPGYAQDFAALVYYDGSVFYFGCDVCGAVCVRPALWINLDS